MKAYTFLTVSLLCCSLHAAEEFKPFPVDWPREANSLATVSFLLEAPAGKDGFVRVKDGHFVRPDGKRLRFWGINATAHGALPPKEDAPTVAAHLARLGLNCVRFHFLDRVAPTGLIAANRDDTRALDPQQLDKLDFFIAELKKRGIYSDLNLNVARTYKAGDGVRDFELLGFAKSLTYFDERLLELQREYARQLLTHRNPYTGAEYRHEPAVALVEFVNENSLVEAWWNNRLLGESTAKNPGTWTDIPASYARALTEKYNAWLKQHVTTAELAQFRRDAAVGSDDLVPRLRKEQFGKASKQRFEAEAGFYMDVERNFFLNMAKYLREDLGVKQLLVGNSDHGHGNSGYPILVGTSLLDIVDGHIYWQHPHYLTDPKNGKRTGFDITNTPMTDDPLHSTAVQLSRSAVAGKPFIVTEANHPFPNEYACEGVPILAAYAALQDWDGVFSYTLAHDDVLALKAQVTGHFDFAKDPVKMGQLAVGALLFERGDVQAARQTLARTYTREQVIESIRLPYSAAPFFTPGFPASLALQHAVRIASFDGPPTVSISDSPANPIASDTGELQWQTGERKSGLVIVNTPRSQALIGFIGSGKAATSNLAVDIAPSFSAVTLSALDNQPIARSARLLLTTTARMANSGMEWNDKRTSLIKWGDAPTLIEPVTGKLMLKQLAGARRLEAQPLDGAGRPLGQPISAVKAGDEWVLTVGNPATTSYLISVTR